MPSSRSEPAEKILKIAKLKVKKEPTRLFRFESRILSQLVNKWKTSLLYEEKFSKWMASILSLKHSLFLNFIPRYPHSHFLNYSIFKNTSGFKRCSFENMKNFQNFCIETLCLIFQVSMYSFFFKIKFLRGWIL